MSFNINHINRLDNRLDILQNRINYLCELMEGQYIRNNHRLQTRRSNMYPNFNSTAPPTTAPTEETLEFSFVPPPSNLLSTLLNLSNQTNNTTERLTLTEINENTTILNINNASEETCSICRANYEENNICRKINSCGHIFHASCLDGWLADNSTCPLCRTSVVPTTN